jgi:hypothetical protein
MNTANDPPLAPTALPTDQMADTGGCMCSQWFNQLCPTIACGRLFDRGFLFGRDTMKQLSLLGLSAMLAVGLASLPVSASAQQKSLKEQLVGTWTLVSCDEILGNAKSPYCVNPSGILMLDAGGRYALLIAAHGRPAGVRSASAAQAPAEIIRAVAQGLLANFGTWSVNEANRTFTRHVEGALFPSIEGLDLAASVTLDGDEVKFVGQQGSRLFRRVMAASAQPAP